MTTGIIFFGGESEDSLENLPWIKDWYKETKDDTKPREVFTCIVGDKGIYIETGEHKSFIFRKESVFRHLKEALAIWSKESKPTKPLVVSYIHKKTCYGIHHDLPEVIWTQDDTRFTSKRSSDNPSKNDRQFQNPFLTPNNPTGLEETTNDSSGKRKRKETPPGEPTEA